MSKYSTAAGIAGLAIRERADRVGDNMRLEKSSLLHDDDDDDVDDGNWFIHLATRSTSLSVHLDVLSLWWNIFMDVSKCECMCMYVCMYRSTYIS